MKKLSLTALTLLFSLSIFAQDWAPFHKNDVVHYAFLGTDSLTNTIRVDSVYLDGGDSVYRFNKIVARCFDCQEEGLFYPNQPQFLGYSVQFDDKLYKFIGKDTFIIDINKRVGDSWNFNNTNIAEVIAQSEQEYLGVIDSVRIIVVNTDTILLGKKLGIIRFDYQQDNPLTMIGEKSKSIGKHIPTFKDFYSYQPGNILLYEYNFDLSHIKSGHYRTTQVRYEILKVIHLSDDSAVYLVNQDEYIRYNSAGFPETKVKVLSQEKRIVFKENGSSYYSNELVPKTGIAYQNCIIDSSIRELTNSDKFFLYAQNKYGLTSVYRSKSNDGYIKTIKPYGGNLGKVDSYLLDFLNDSTLIDNEVPARSEYAPASIGANSPFEFLFKEGIGLLYTRYVSEYGGDFYVGHVKLIGAQLNGKLYGNIQPEGFFKLSNNTITTDNNLTVYPNPASGQVTINMDASAGNSHVSLYNSTGKVVYEQDHNFSSGNLAVDVASLPKGIYYVRVKIGDEFLTKKLRIH